MRRIMEQKQAIKSKTDEIEVVDTPKETSKEVVEEANCCLAEIDALLEEVDVKEKLPDWHPDAEYDPSGAKPTWSYTKFKDWCREQGITGRAKDELEYRAWDAKAERMKQWYTSRGLTYDPCTC